MSSQDIPLSHRFIAGAVAGTSELLVMYPLDVLKTRFQISTGANQSTFQVLKQMIQSEGFKVYRGIASPLVMEPPKRAIKFTANESFKPFFTGSDGKLGQLGAIGAGLSAGCTEGCFVVPFELVKIRLQDPANKGLYENSFDCIKKVASNEGIFAFYKGLESTLWRQGSWNAAYFGLIFGVKRALPSYPDSKPKQTFINFIAGVIGGTCATTVNTPFDVVKSRIQNVSAGPQKYNWALPSLVTVYKEEGFSALYKGYIPKVVRLGPGGGILLVVFEATTNYLRKIDPRFKNKQN